MNKAMTFVYGAGIGAALMYLTDPQMGRRRRAVARDKMGSFVRDSQDVLGKTVRDASHRARGFAAQAQSAAGRVGEKVGKTAKDFVDDDTLIGRIRANIGHAVSHPRAINVEAIQGRVTLTGHVLAREAQRLLKRVSSVRGVHEVEDRLQVHDNPGDVPELQGEPREPRAGFNPTTRFLLSALTAVVATFFLVRNRPLLAAAEVAGTGMLLRARRGSSTRKRFEAVGAGR